MEIARKQDGDFRLPRRSAQSAPQKQALAANIRVTCPTPGRHVADASFTGFSGQTFNYFFPLIFDEIFLVHAAQKLCGGHCPSSFTRLGGLFRYQEWHQVSERFLGRSLVLRHRMATDGRLFKWLLLAPSTMFHASDADGKRTETRGGQ